MSLDDWAISELYRNENETALRRPSAHQSMFKYVSLGTKTSWDSLVQALNDFTLMGATAASLNDPFELSPHVFDDINENLVNKIYKQTLTSRLAKGRDSVVKLDVDELREGAYAHVSKLVRNVRIISFCERSDSPLLWSHYANKYKGACIHFLGRAFHTPTIRIGYVNYSAYRPMMPLSLPMSVMSLPRVVGGVTTSAEIEKSYFFSKAADWAYENEIRIVYSTPSVKNVKFSQDGLVSIIAGPRMEPDERKRLEDEVRKSAIPYLPIRDATLSQNSFSVNVG